MCFDLDHFFTFCTHQTPSKTNTCSGNHHRNSTTTASHNKRFLDHKFDIALLLKRLDLMTWKIQMSVICGYCSARPKHRIVVTIFLNKSASLFDLFPPSNILLYVLIVRRKMVLLASRSNRFWVSCAKDK